MIFFKKFLVLFFLSCLAAGFWISPLLFKGYSPDSVGGGSLLARNLAISGKYSLENSQNIILSSTQVGEQGLPSSIGNRLTPQIYSYIIEIFGPLSVNKIVLVSVFLNALALLIFSLATLKLFGFKLAVLFSFVYMLLPSCWRSPYTISGYEFAILFFAVFLLFFVLAWQSKARLKIIYLIVSGLFLAFSALSKEAFWLMLPVIFIFFAAKRNWRSLLWFFASAILIIGVFYLPQFLSGKNSYLTLLFPDAGKINFSEYSYYAHLFPDPYTYHNLKDDFVKSQKDLVVREGIFNSLETRKVLANMGYESIGIIYRIILGFYLLIRHIFRFFSFETYGGPLIFILFILGIWQLRSQNKEISRLIIYTIVGFLLIMSFVVLVSRDHTMDFAWAFALPVAVGIKKILDKVKENFSVRWKYCLLVTIISLAIAYNFVLAGRVAWGRVYDQSSWLKVKAYEDLISAENVSEKEIIAFGMPAYDGLALNYLTDKNLVAFAPETVQALIEKGELQKAFSDYKVKYIVGYPDKLTQEIVSSAQVKNLCSDDIKIIYQPVSPLRSWLLNMVK